MALLLALAAPAAAAPVEYDRHSMILNGKRVFLNGGEVHYFRMPSPRQWPEVLAKMRAAGLNEVSIYIPWQLHEPRPGQFRFRGRFDFERFLRDARDAGLYVVARPGPYIQGEIDGGGYPSWLLGGPGILRTVEPRYTAAWKRWYAEVMPRIARWELGGPNRGTVIAVQVENEFPGDSDEGRAYMRDLVATAKSNGVDVPVTHNDVQFLGVQISRGLFVDLVDVFGFDNYPYQFRCCPEWNEETFSQVDTFESYYRGKGVVRSPLYTAEIQGGIEPIAGDDGGTPEQRYRTLTGYGTVQDLSLYGQGLTFVNRYMTFGGTTWGNLVFPNLGTSYDYAAPIREWGGLGPRFDELHRLALQTRAADRSIAATEAADDSGVEASDPDALYRVRRSTLDGTLHVFLRNADPGPDRAPALTIGGRTTKPVPLPGHSARWLVARANLAGWKIDLTTAEVAVASRDTLALFGDRGKPYEAVLHGRRIEFTPGKRPQLRRFRGRRLLLLSRQDAARLWRRGSQFVLGPRLVTRREVETDRRTSAIVIGRRHARRVTLAGPPRKLGLPKLTRWRFRAETPERQPGYDDSGWRVADRQTTSNQMQPLTSPVLGADEYGFPGAGFVWYRGRFTGRAGGVCLEGRHRYHVWVNGRSVGTVTSGAEVPGPSGLGGLGAAPPQNQPATLAFPEGATGDGENVIAVLVESWGHNMDAGAANQAKQVRGLISASLDRPGSPPCGFSLGGETTTPLGQGGPVTLPSPPKPSGGIEWRLRGGDPLEYPNVSSLAGELDGWHTSRFDDRGWARVGLPATASLGAGEVGWFRTEFDPRIPRGIHAPLGLELRAGSFPAEIYLNGVHVARAGRNRQERFVLPSGVLRPRGRNVLAIARWNVAGAGRMDRPRLFAWEVTRTRPAGTTLASPR